MILSKNDGTFVCDCCGKDLTQAVQILGLEDVNMIHLASHHRDKIRSLFQAATTSTDAEVLKRADALSLFEAKYLGDNTSLSVVNGRNQC